MMDGGRTGLVSASDVVEEARQKRAAEEARIRAMKDEQSGRGASTMYRDKDTGQRMSREEVERMQRDEAAQKRALEEARRPEWGAGLKQRRDAEEAAAEAAREAAKPFARYADDEELDAHYRKQDRWGDPMAGLMRKPTDEAAAAETRAAALTVGLERPTTYKIPSETPAHSWMRRGVHPTPNRYGIKPGRHWDGVDRSNGFERSLFKQQNERRAKEQHGWQMSQSQWE